MLTRIIKFAQVEQNMINVFYQVFINVKEEKKQLWSNKSIFVSVFRLPTEQRGWVNNKYDISQSKIIHNETNESNNLIVSI